MFQPRDTNDSPAAAPVERGDNIAKAGAALSTPESQNLIKDTMAAAGNTAGNHLPELTITYSDKAGATPSPAGPGGDAGGAPTKPADVTPSPAAAGADAGGTSKKPADASTHDAASSTLRGVSKADLENEKELALAKVDEGRGPVRKYNGGNLSDPDFDDYDGGE